MRILIAFLLFCLTGHAAIFQNTFTTNQNSMGTGALVTQSNLLLGVNHTDTNTFLQSGGTALAPVFARVTMVNGTNFSPMNLVDTASITWARSGSNVTATAAGAAAGDTTATNIVALSQSGTNLVAQMDFSLVARGGIFTLSLTNNCFIGTPANVNNTDFKKAWLTIRQPSTGTCIVTFTNGSFAFPEGIMPVPDTNANAITYYQFVSSPWTNGLVEGWMSLKSQRVP